MRALNGDVEAHYYHTRKKIYTLVNQTDKPRVVYIEHPRAEADDWEFIAGRNYNPQCNRHQGLSGR